MILRQQQDDCSAPPHGSCRLLCPPTMKLPGRSATSSLAGWEQRPMEWCPTTIWLRGNYETKGFIAEMRRIGVTPHVPQYTARSGRSAIDGPTTRHQGYAKSINALSAAASRRSLAGSHRGAGCASSSCAAQAMLVRFLACTRSLTT